MKKSILGILLGIALSAVGVLFAANTIDSPPRVERFWPIVLGVAATLVSWVLQGAVLAVLAHDSFKGLPILKTTRVYLESQAIGAVTPFAGGEIGYQLLELRRLGVHADFGGAVLTIKSALNGIVLIAGAVVGALFVSKIPFVERGLPLPKARTLLIGAAVIAFVWIAVFLVARLRRRRSRRAEEPSPQKQNPGWKRKLAGFFHDYKESLKKLWREDPRSIAVAGALMVLYWLIYPLLGVFGLMAAGWSGEGWPEVFIAQYVLFLVIPLAPTPGNSGAAEVAFAALMGAYVPQGALLGGLLIWRVLNHYSELVVGAFLAGNTVWEDVEIARREFGSD